MKKLTVLLLTLALLTASAAFGQQNVATAPVCTNTTVLATATANARIKAAPTTQTKTVYINGVATSVNTTASIAICSVHITVKQTTGAADFGLISGTGTNCGTGPANVTSQFFGTASVVDKFDSDLGAGSFYVVPQGKDLCLKLSAAPTDSTVTVVWTLLPAPSR